MKKRYVRTEDGIFEVVKEEVLCGVRFYDIETKEHLNRIRVESIIAYADIEELCDRFIFHYQKIRDGVVVDEVHKECRFLWEAKEYYDDCKNPTKEIKGAIYTDKGLIYVAKLNENGDLELV